MRSFTRKQVVVGLGAASTTMLMAAMPAGAQVSVGPPAGPGPGAPASSERPSPASPPRATAAISADQEPPFEQLLAALNFGHGRAVGPYGDGTPFVVKGGRRATFPGKSLDLRKLGFVAAGPEPFLGELYGDDVEIGFAALRTGVLYKARVIFAESYWTGLGQRSFGVDVQGRPWLEELDIVKAAGGPNVAMKRDWVGEATDGGQIRMRFKKGSADLAKVAAVELYALTPDAVVVPRPIGGVPATRSPYEYPFVGALARPIGALARPESPTDQRTAQLLGSGLRIALNAGTWDIVAVDGRRAPTVRVFQKDPKTGQRWFRQTITCPPGAAPSLPQNGDRHMIVWGTSLTTGRPVCWEFWLFEWGTENGQPVIEAGAFYETDLTSTGAAAAPGARAGIRASGWSLAMGFIRPAHLDLENNYVAVPLAVGLPRQLLALPPHPPATAADAFASSPTWGYEGFNHPGDLIYLTQEGYERVTAQLGPNRSRLTELVLRRMRDGGGRIADCLGDAQYIAYYCDHALVGVLGASAITTALQELQAMKPFLRVMVNDEMGTATSGGGEPVAAMPPPFRQEVIGPA